MDLKFVSTDEISKRVEDPVILFERNNVLTNAFAGEPAVFPYPDLQWIEDRFWVWIHYGAGKIGRGEIFEVIEFISFLRQTVIAPLLLIKRGKLPRGVRKIEVDAANDMPIMLQTVVSHNAPDCLAAIRTIAELYTDLRAYHADDKLIIRERSEQAAKDYLDVIAARLRKD